MKPMAKRTRGRPRTFNDASALEAALVLFWRHGYEGTSIAQLTDAMKITAPSLYAAFGSKEQLYQKALDLYVNTQGDFVAQTLSAPGSTREAIARLLKEAAVRFTRTNWPAGCLVATGAIRCASDNGTVLEMTATVRRASTNLLKQRIDQAIANHELEPDEDSSGLAAFYASVVQGMSVQAIDGAKQAQLMKIAEFAMAAWPGEPVLQR